MIIEVLTAFNTVKIAWEALEILHLAHVGHIAGKAGCKGVKSINHVMQRGYQKWQDHNNPAQQLEREVKTLYDFQAIGNATQEEIKSQAEAYLTKLSNSVSNLKNAKESFVDIYTSLKELVDVLKSNDGLQLFSYLLRFKSNFESFKAEFNLFSLSVEAPPRQLLYIADLLSESEEVTNPVINRFNVLLETIKTYINTLEETKKDKKIAEQFKQGFDAIHALLPTTSSSSAHSFEQLQQSMHNPEQLSETIHKILPNNTELATTCTDIIQISTAFQQSHETEQTDPLKDNPKWFRLRTEAEQLEVGQRIFLHAMSETCYSAEKKLLLAQIFLRQHVSKHVINQVKIDLSSHELACLLRLWQIKQCEQLIQFLRTLTQGVVLPAHDPNGLLEWLKTTRRAQTPVELFIKVLVSPCCFSQCSIESALLKLKDLLPHESSDALIKKYRDSHWGTIREKNDTLIQLPESLSSNILPRDRLEQDDQSKNSNVVSSVMYKLAKMLITDIKKLKAELQKNYDHVDVLFSSLSKKEKEESEAEKNQEHEKGIERIKKGHRYIHGITSPSSSLSPYLYHVETINEVEKKQQVPTGDDLLHVIYRGIDPNGICHWKSFSSQPYSQSNQLLYYFLLNKDESLIKAWTYAFRECQVNALPLYPQLFPTTNRPLALRGPQEETSEGSQEENVPLLQVFLQNSKKISFTLANSKALNGVSKKTMQETEIVVEQLQNYHMLAFTRVNPEHRKNLPFMQQLECLIKNVFKFGQEIAQERLLSVKIIIGNLWAVVSAEDVAAINLALNDMKTNYESICQGAQRKERSALYAILKKAFDGPISYIISQFSEVEQKQFKLEEEEKNKLKGKVKSLEETVNKVEQAKAEVEAKLKESEEKRTQDKAEMDVRLEQYIAEMDEKMKKVTDYMDFIKSQQPASTSSASNDQTQESSPIRFFKP